MSGYVDIDIDSSQIERLAMDLQATPAQLQKALRSTYTKMARWVKTRSERGLAKELQVKTAIIRRRMKSTMAKGGQGFRVWYGLDPISLIHLGAKETKTGVTAGKHRRPGAFIANGRGDGRQVFRRTGAGRLPIEKQGLDIKDKADVFIEDEIIGGSGFESQFWKTLEHELQWQTRKH